MQTRNCPYCGKSFLRMGRAECCSDLCKQAKLREYHKNYFKETYIKKQPVVVNCRYCGRSFLPPHTMGRYCSDQCRRRQRCEEVCDRESVKMTDSNYREAKNARTNERRRIKNLIDPVYKRYWQDRRNEWERNKRVNNPGWREKKNKIRCKQQKDRYDSDPIYKSFMKYRSRLYRLIHKHNPDWVERVRKRLREHGRFKQATDPVWREKRREYNRKRHYEMGIIVAAAIMQGLITKEELKGKGKDKKGRETALKQQNLVAAIKKLEFNIPEGERL